MLAVKRFVPALMFAATMITFTTGLAPGAPQSPEPDGSDAAKVIPMRQRVQVMQRFWDWKRDNLLPQIMDEQGVEMWIVRSDEQPEYRQTSYSEGPFYTSLLPANHEGMVLPSQHEQLEIPRFLVFHRESAGVDYVEPGDYDGITEIVRRRDPATIAIAASGNGPMLEALAEYGDRTIDSRTLGMRWLETMGPEQISIYRYVQGVANDLIAEGFSNRVIVPDVTTVEDLNWWFRHKMLELGIEKENHPTIGIQRKPANISRYAEQDSPDFFAGGSRSENGMNPTIRRGDIVSLDSDIMLLGLVTDSHQHGYVLEVGEQDVPEDLSEALRIVNRMQDRFAAEMQVGRTGKQVMAATEQIPWEDGVIDTELGFHPPPMFLRRFTVNGLMFSRGTWVAGAGSHRGYKRHLIVDNDHVIHANTLYAFEPHTRVAVPGWGENGVELGLGQIAVVTEDGLRYLDRAQPADGWHVIR